LRSSFVYYVSTAVGNRAIPFKLSIVAARSKASQHEKAKYNCRHQHNQPILTIDVVDPVHGAHVEIVHVLQPFSCPNDLTARHICHTLDRHKSLGYVWRTTAAAVWLPATVSNPDGTIHTAVKSILLRQQRRALYNRQFAEELPGKLAADIETGCGGNAAASLSVRRHAESVDFSRPGPNPNG
jgi:hypothetical protein